MIPAPTTIRSSILVEFKQLALSLGLDPIMLLNRAGIDPRYLDDADLVLPMRSVVDLLESTAVATGIDDFGLRLAELPGLPDLGPLTLMVREAETFRSALQTLVAFIHLHSDAPYLYLDESDTPILVIDILVEGTSYRRQIIEASVGSIISILRRLLGENWIPELICFRHSRPASVAHHERFFRCPVDFLQDFNGIVLRREDLDKKLPDSSPARRREVERYVRSLNVGPSDAYAHRVMQIIAIGLPVGEAKASIIARRMGTDVRTLNRRLARVGLNYSTVLQNTRRNLAVQYMLDRERPLSDIAGLIGFGSLSAFSNWFCRTFEATPRRWRKAEQQRRGAVSNMPPS